MHTCSIHVLLLELLLLFSPSQSLLPHGLSLELDGGGRGGGRGRGGGGGGGNKEVTEGSYHSYHLLFSLLHCLFIHFFRAILRVQMYML